VRSLSGGERNRLLLARLFARPATVLVLDEPTNDLDIETIDLLEELLQDYPGTVFLVSHDRTFLDNVVTSTIAYEGDGVWREFEGGVEDWLQQSLRSQALRAAAATSPGAKPASEHKDKGESSPQPPQDGRSTLQKKKLSYKEQRELEQLPDRIAALETEQQAIQQELADGSLYTRDPQRATALHTREGEIEEELLLALERWTALAP
jgi:ATP-binding cassette subfamily F protein uup